ncbi:protein ABHD13-like [Symsagittifera roscoffensis]|uniref:protein ABHD13-like n=1 Tax=Symsagittifera roscoffensis TaxID=84072 RepID=UPI00307BB1D0
MRIHLSPCLKQLRFFCKRVFGSGQTMAVNRFAEKIPLGNEILNVTGNLWKGSAYSILPLLLAFNQFHNFWIFLLVVISLLGVIYFAQDILLYHCDNPPNSRLYVQSLSLQTPKHAIGGVDNIQMLTEDSVVLHGYLLKAVNYEQQNYPTIVYLHGNAGNIGHRLPNATEMVAKLKCNVLLVEYRGYGKSTGSPSEYGLYLDAKAAINFIRTHTELGGSQIVLFGRSLGGAVAIHSATSQSLLNLDKISKIKSSAASWEWFQRLIAHTELGGSQIVLFGRSLGGAVAIHSATSQSLLNLDKTSKSNGCSASGDTNSLRGENLGSADGLPVAMLIVENTFTHIADVAEVMFQIPGFTFIPRLFYKNKYASVDKMGRVEVPSLFISGQADQLVPPHMMANLFTKCAATKKRLLKVRGGTHNETWMTSGYYDSIRKFMDEVLTSPESWQLPIRSNHGGGGTPRTSNTPSMESFGGPSQPLSAANINSPAHSVSVGARRDNETTEEFNYPQNEFADNNSRQV